MNRPEKKLSKTVTIKLPLNAASLRKILQSITVPDTYDFLEAFTKSDYDFKGEIFSDGFHLKDKRKFGENTGIFFNTVAYEGTILPKNEDVALVIKTKLTGTFMAISLIETAWLTWVVADLLASEQLFTGLLFLLMYASVIILFYTLIKSKMESGLDNFIKEISYRVEEEKKIPAEEPGLI